jgi:ribonucleoside-diphosphate reductase alpha chain
MPTKTNEPTRISQISENAETIMARLWLKRDENGKVCETPEECARRVANYVAQARASYGKLSAKEKMAIIEEWSEKYFQMIANLDFTPNSPTYTGAGSGLGQLSACFVLPVEDSMNPIFTAVKYGALIHQSGGGTGYSFDKIREKGAMVKTTNGWASGPLSFMGVFDEATETIKQGGAR